MIIFSFTSFLGTEHTVQTAPGREPCSEFTDAGRPEETGVRVWQQVAREFRMGP